MTRREREAVNQMARHLVDAGSTYMYAVAQGADQKQFFESVRDGLVANGFELRKAANITRLIIEAGSRKCLGESHYGEAASRELISEAL